MPDLVNIEFCINCNKLVGYHILSHRKTKKVRGRTFRYTELSAYCNECGAETYVPEINDRNCEARERAYKEGK